MDFLSGIPPIPYFATKSQSGGGGSNFPQQNISTCGWSMMFTENGFVAEEKILISRKVNLTDADYRNQLYCLM